MQILIQNRQRKYPLNERQVRRWVRDILKMQGEEEVEIGLAFVNNRTIRKYNRDYRGKDTATDVLSFPMRDVGADLCVCPAGRGAHAGAPLLGDLMISLEKAYEEAHLFYHGKSDHLLFLLIHGILHLLGYDHEESRNEEARMKRRERKIFEKIYVGRKNVPKSSP